MIKKTLFLLTFVLFFLANHVLAISEAEYSVAEDWDLNAKYMDTAGINPMFIPLTPGFKHILVNPESVDGDYRKEIKVTDELESFKIKGIGSFDTRVIHEEEFYDGNWVNFTVNWVARDKRNGNVYLFGQNVWEIDNLGKKILKETWRAGEDDGKGVAQAGLLMPGNLKNGFRFITSGSKAIAYVGAEYVRNETVVTPAGTFQNCILLRLTNLINVKDLDKKIYCKDIGIVMDTDGARLLASDAIEKSDMASFGKFHREKPENSKQIKKISEIQAKKIALQKLPGNASSIEIERKRGKVVYTVEIQEKSGKETDVFVDIETGEIIGMD